MKKIKVYAMIPEERPYIEAWAKEHADEYELDITTDELTVDNVESAKGFDGVTTMQMYPIVEPVYSKLKEYGIKNIAQRSAGFDMYDLEAATANDIIITNVPSYSPESIAEFAIYSALRVVRKISLIEARVKEQNFTWESEILSRPIHDMTVAVIGVGRIGSRVARLYKNGFGAKVVAYDIEPRDEFRDIVEYQDSLLDAIKDADIVTLHMPLTEENTHQFNEERFSQMKEGAVLVNTARGKIVDTKALIKAVDSGHLAGATLDVYEDEADYMPKDWRNRVIEDDLFVELLNHPRITYTPHIAYYTDKAVKNLAEGGLNATKDIIETGNTKNRVN